VERRKKSRVNREQLRCCNWIQLPSISDDVRRQANRQAMGVVLMVKAGRRTIQLSGELRVERQLQAGCVS
jgi:hypothetical protein